MINKLLNNVKVKSILGEYPITINDVCTDSRQVVNGSLFVAINGAIKDGHDFIDTAINNGAKVIVCERCPKQIVKNVCYVLVANSSIAAGIISSNFFDNPSKKLKLIGVTGTNGKTTTATLLFNLFSSLGYYCGLFSTVCIKIGNRELETTHTTPDTLSLNKFLNMMVNEGCEYCFMEVSSHAAHQHRIAGLHFFGGIFTNITHDHLDYHKTFVNYIAAKKMFFDYLPPTAFALTNIDDRNGEVMVGNTKAKKYTYGLSNPADFHAKIEEMYLDGSNVLINNKEVFIPLPAKFNVYNYLAVYSAAILSGVDEYELRTCISKTFGAKGRFQLVSNKEHKTVIVDYAHTPDALKNILSSIRELNNDGKIICVFGAGGERDKTKRPVMGKIAVEYADECVITSDNPRSEEPQSIINDILSEMDTNDLKKVLTIVNREEAINAALRISKNNDVVLIAGKGHENYQEINGVKHQFNDVEIIKKYFNY